MAYTPAINRYNRVPRNWFRRCGKSGLLLPAVSFGLWHNFGNHADDSEAEQLCFTAFDLGITHFDLANNYGPPPGSAEKRFRKILKQLPRDELIISTKAGYGMGPGPYADWGSRKYLLSSLDASLKRMKVDYVDIFYHHRPDPQTPLDETLGALDTAVKQGKALYAGISNYTGEQTQQAVQAVENKDYTRLLIHQVCYNMLSQGPQTDLFPHTEDAGMGVICFCPLAQGLLTDRYLSEPLPKDSRAADPKGFLKPDQVTTDLRRKIHQLNDHARQRGQTLAEMALAWALNDKRVTSVLIGASKVDQIKQNVKVLENPQFSEDELTKLNAILTES